MWQWILIELAGDADLEEILMASAVICALRHAAGARKEESAQAIGRSCGGLTTKIHALRQGGKCQGSCRINHVASVSELALPRGGFPGLSKTEAGGVQSRVDADQRAGLASLAAW